MDAWAIEKLSAAHDRTVFTCGNASLDTFLKALVSQYAKRRLGQTYVAIRPGETRICGYYTVASGSMAPHDVPQAVRKKLPKHAVPTVHLGRLAVDVSCQRLGLGRILLFHCLAKALQVSRELGVFAVDVLAIDDPSSAFYARYGFIPLEDHPRHLYLSMETVEQLFD
jgi:ribosomal protein S18 acetylase RimI-like enzyme